MQSTRDGNLLLERMAAWKVVNEIQTFSASSVLQILFAPQTLAEWAKKNDVNSSLLYNVLGGAAKSRPVLEKMASHLDVPVSSLEQLIQLDPGPSERQIPEKPPAMHKAGGLNKGPIQP